MVGKRFPDGKRGFFFYYELKFGGKQAEIDIRKGTVTKICRKQGGAGKL